MIDRKERRDMMWMEKDDVEIAHLVEEFEDKISNGERVLKRRPRQTKRYSAKQ